MRGGPTLQGAAQQGVQLRVDLRLLLQHVEQQLVLGGAVDLRLLQPALHHLQLGVLLRRLQTLKGAERESLVRLTAHPSTIPSPTFLAAWLLPPQAGPIRFHQV